MDLRLVNRVVVRLVDGELLLAASPAELSLVPATTPATTTLAAA
jgi:hypothetical protein